MPKQLLTSAELTWGKLGGQALRFGKLGGQALPFAWQGLTTMAHPVETDERARERFTVTFAA